MKILPCTEADKDRPSLDMPDGPSAADTDTKLEASHTASPADVKPGTDAPNPFGRYYYLCV